MVDDGRLTALEERYASTSERVAELEARWQELADQYAAWRNRDRGDPGLSIVEDHEFPDGYAVLRAQYEVDLELFELVRSMRDLEHEIGVLRAPLPAPEPAEDLAATPVPVPVPVPRRDRNRTLRVAAIALGVVVLLAVAYVVTRGSRNQPTVELGVPAQQAAPVTWKLHDAKIVKIAKKEGGGCLKTVDVAIGARYAGQLAYVRIDGPDFRVAKDRRTRLDDTGRGTVGYETKRCAASPAAEVRVVQVGDDVNVAAKRSR